MTLNKYFPFAFIYFFINSAGLPFGLTWMALLAPFFYVWILLVRKKEILWPFILVLVPFVFFQLSEEVKISDYILSTINLVLVYIFCQAVYTFLRQCKEPEIIFRRILVLNFIFCLVAIVIYFTPWYKLLWIEQNITTGFEHVRRLRLLTYEPSYYALLFIPVFFFYLLQYLFRQNTIRGSYLLLMLFTPYLLSLSFGVIGAALLAGLLVWLVYFTRLTRKRRVFNTIINAGVVLGLATISLLIFFRQSLLLSRLGNILSGKDTSGRGRTTDSYILAEKILATGNEYWGIGMGQIKTVGEGIMRNYYLHTGEFSVTISNVVAETLVIFGWLGLTLRLFIEIFLFFYTRVWTNYYRLLLFFFMFIFQFGGSFITNMAEYVIWILAFSNVFKQFDVKKQVPDQVNK